MSKQFFYIMSAMITRRIKLTEKSRLVTIQMFFTGKGTNGEAMFSTDRTQAFPFLKKGNAELMAKCLNESSAKIEEVGNDYGILRQATDEKTAQAERHHGQITAPTNL